MLRNLPVTQREFAYPSGKSLVSMTDPKGRITYCNPAFISVSGFTKDELLGQSHNVVRHPDMPPEAFRDLWATVQSGMPWTGLVKNRRKDGDHYWVRANVTPVKDGDRIIGFLSVRSEPTRGEVEAASGLYARMNAELERGGQRIFLQAGAVRKSGVIAATGHFAANVWQSIGGWNFVLTCIPVILALACTGFFDAAIVAPIAILMTAIVTGLSRRSEAARLQQAVHDVLGIAAGDLGKTPQVGAKGLIGTLQAGLAQTALNLRTVIGDSRAEVDAMLLSVNEISAGNQDMSSRTESQASSLEETAASMEQISSTVKHTASAAAEGAHRANEAAALTKSSNDAVEQVAHVMQDIKRSSDQMGEIIQTIESVAFQTNILALNAAVEAARAGDAGRGFAVVATEVRALAKRSADASKEIKALIQGSAAAVDKGVQEVKNASVAVERSLKSVADVNGVLAQISASAQEQQQGVVQITEAITHLDTITQQNAAMVEQLAAASVNLKGQVVAVSESMQIFKIGSGDHSLAARDAVALRKDVKAAMKGHPSLSQSHDDIAVIGTGATAPPRQLSSKAKRSDPPEQSMHDEWDTF